MCDRITNGCSIQYREFGPKNRDVQQHVAGMVIQKVRNCILLLHLCFSTKPKKKKKSSVGMVSINHGVIAVLCIKKHTKEQAKNSKCGSKRIYVV